MQQSKALISKHSPSLAGAAEASKTIPHCNRKGSIAETVLWHNFYMGEHAGLQKWKSNGKGSIAETAFFADETLVRVNLKGTCRMADTNTNLINFNQLILIWSISNS